MRTDILNKKDDIKHWISDGRTKAFICKQLNCRYNTLDLYLEKLGITYSGNQGGRGKKSNYRISADEYRNRTGYVNSHRLRIKLLEEGIREYKCDCCGFGEWMGGPIPLELHHKNGNRFDNSEENTPLLCPNCHALTENHAGRGCRRGKK